jgi:hypothetical protein
LGIKVLTGDKDAFVRWGDLEEIRTTRLGGITLTALELSKVVIFEKAFPRGNRYRVFLQPLAGVSVGFWPSALNDTDFTINVSLGVDATFAYLAVEL